MIHIQKHDRSATRRCAANDCSMVVAPLEMLGPLLTSGIEELHPPTRVRVGRARLIKFARVADRTGEGEILIRGSSPFGLRNDVIHFEGIMAKNLRRPAIFAKVPRSAYYSPAERGLHWTRTSH
jgi:hypothetical protein